MTNVQKDSIPVDPVPVSDKGALLTPNNFCASYMDTGVNNYKVDITRLKSENNLIR